MTTLSRHPGGRTCEMQALIILAFPPILLLYAWRTRQLKAARRRTSDR